MTDLQLGLLVLGAAGVVGVLAYNRLQERSARKQAERAFAGPRGDALVDAPDARREPVLGPLAATRKAAQPGALPDERLDYIVLMRVPVGIPGAAVLEAWRPIEQRFSTRVLLAGSDGTGWRAIGAGEFGSFTSLRAAFQLVGRAGVAGDAEVLEFRSEVENLAARIHAEVSAPEMRAALDKARELDRLCADNDVQVAFHVVGGSEEGLDAAFADARAEGAPYQVGRRPDGLTLVLDVPRTEEVIRAYESMSRAARQLAARLGGRLVDDRGQAIDERALAAIEAQLEPIRRSLSEHGIEPGSPLAKRLFS